MKKKILHVIQGGKGGTLQYLKLLIPRINNNKYENTVICYGEVYKELSEIGINAFEIKMVRNISPINDLISFININKYIIENKPDLLYAHSSKAGILTRIIAKIHGISCIYNPHGWAFNIDTSIIAKKIYEILEKVASNWVDKIILISKAEFNDAVEKNICHRKKLVIINNGIDISKYDSKINYEFKESLGIDKNTKVIGMCCRIEKQKAPLTYVCIAKKVITTFKDCIFVLVGDGELIDEVKNCINHFKLQDNVIVTGWCLNPEKYINIFDVGVLTSRWEGFGLVLVEYMASGKPVVASNVGGIPYIVRDKEDGFLCNQNDIDNFAERILELLQNERLYNKIRSSALKRAEKFDIVKLVEEHEILFDELLYSSKFDSDISSQ